MSKYYVLLPDKFKQQLINTPETGMGYHIVDVTLTDGTVRFKKIVLNCDELILLDESERIFGLDIKEIKISQS
jgi:hypothetical protein